jgi:Tol biopolymer transport system component
MIDLATKMETQITFGTSVDDGYPNWSPDGTFLVFDSKRSENRDLYLCPSSGGEEKRVTFNPSYDDHGSWSPDGTKIAFGSNRAGNMDIWVVEIPSI